MAIRHWYWGKLILVWVAGAAMTAFLVVVAGEMETPDTTTIEIVMMLAVLQP